MDEQEFFNKIKELQKQRDLLKKDVTVLECKINELRDILELKNIKKGYYTNNLGLFCKVYDIKGDNIHVYELDTTDLLSLTKETYYWRSFIDKRDKLNVRRDELLQEMKQFQEDYIKALPVKIGDKIMDEDGRVGQLSRIVPYRSPSERFMCATLSLTLFFHMEKKDGTYDNREVYVHGFPIKL